MTRCVVPLIAVTLSACATPDVSTEVEASHAYLVETQTSIRSQIEPLAAREFAQAEADMIARGEQVLSEAGLCNPGIGRAAGIATSECRLIEHADPTGKSVNASEVLAALDGLNGYWSGLLDLSRATRRSDIDAATAQLTASLKATSEESGQIGVFAARAIRPAELAQASGGFAVDQYRFAKLRQIMRRADPIIGELSLKIAAWYDLRPGSEIGLAEDFTRAITDMEVARLSGSAQDHLRAVAQVRVAFKALKQAEAHSPAHRVMVLRDMHTKILRRLTNPTPEEVLSLLETTNEILNQLEQNNGDE